MGSSFDGLMHDPSKCGKLSMEKKRELVYEIAKCSNGAAEMLHSWSRRELLEVLCAEMGKERKYTGLTKFKMIEHLLKIVSKKKSKKLVDETDPESEPSHANNENASKRRRKTDNPSRLPIVMNHFPTSKGNEDIGNSTLCQNSACRAIVHKDDTFCKRCSCCICQQYDENKDPSLWLVCNSEPPYEDISCGLSCHLECALKHERAGIGKGGDRTRLDGSFQCISCGKVNDLLGCWRKQLMKAKDTRRVDILCYRISLSQKVLCGTEKYQKSYAVVDTAAKKLEAEVGPIAGLPVNMARGIVNRLSCGPEVQKLCGSALESLDLMLSSSSFHPPPIPKIQDSHSISPILIRFEDICSDSLAIILGDHDPSFEENVLYSLWHRKTDNMEYPVEPTCTFLTPNTRFSVSKLIPDTEYLFKVVSFHDGRETGMREVKLTTSSIGNDDSKSLIVERSQSPVTNSSSVSNPSDGDESNNIGDHNDKPTSNYYNYSTKSGKNDAKRLSRDANKDLSDTQNTSTGLREEEMPGDSFSALEESAMREVRFEPNSAIQMEPKGQLLEEANGDNGSSTPVKKGWEVVLFDSGFNTVLPITPCKVENGKNGLIRSGEQEPSSEELDERSGKAEEPQAENSLKKRIGLRWEEGGATDKSLEREYEYCVKIIRRLECEGHVEKNFRVKFLTWYSLRATTQERRIVKVFIDTLIDDPACLAGQLVDTFSEVIASKRPLTVSSGLCMKLWH